MSPLLTYGVVVVLVSALSSLRTVTNRLDGRHVFGVHLLFLAWEIWRLGVVGTETSVAVALFALLTVASYLGRDWWLLSRHDAEATRALVEDSARRLRIDVEQVASGYLLRAKSGSGAIDVRGLPWGRALMRVRAEGEAPKVKLLASLLAKSFEPVVPRIRVRMR